jgi:hypothetical protein
MPQHLSWVRTRAAAVGSRRLTAWAMTWPCNDSKQSKSYLCYHRRSCGQYLSIRHSSGAHDQIFVTLIQSGVCWCGTSSLTRGRVCSLQFRLGLASVVILGSESRDSWPYFTASNLGLPQLGGPGPRIYIPQEQGSPVIFLGTAFPFRRLLRFARLRWRYSNQPPNRTTIYVRNLEYYSNHGNETTIGSWRQLVRKHERCYSNYESGTSACTRLYIYIYIYIHTY